MSDIDEYKIVEDSHMYRELKESLISLYKKKGLINSNGESISICDECELSQECYSGAEDRKPNLHNEEWSHISLPWIGRNYDEYKILVLGINPNEDGGIDQLSKLIEYSKDAMAKGKTKLNFGYVYDDGRKYSGTFLWHRMAAYTKAIKIGESHKEESLSKLEGLISQEVFSPENVYREFDSIAYLNHIKCSPLNERSTPTSAMWKNCGKHLLSKELKILKPKWLIVLGSGDNIYRLNENILGSSELNKIGSISYLKTREFGCDTNIIALPHPAAPGCGANRKYYGEIIDTVQLMKKL